MEKFFYSLKGDKLMPRNNGAYFIVFEGPDGSGKTTQAGRLNQHLDKMGLKVHLTAEPTLFGEVGKRIHAILNGQVKADQLELQKLFAEDRREHIKRIIEPALQEGKVVISDRYFFSTFAYGPQNNLEELIQANSDFIMPDIVICLKVDPEICVVRLQEANRKLDLFEKKDKIEEVLKNYMSLSKRFNQFHVLNGERTIHEVKADVINLVEPILK